MFEICWNKKKERINMWKNCLLERERERKLFDSNMVGCATLKRGAASLTVAVFVVFLEPAIPRDDIFVNAGRV